MYVMMTVGNALWLTYGVLIGSLSLTLANFTCLIMVASVLVLKIRDMLRPNLLVELVAAEAGTATGEPVNSNEVLEQPKLPTAAAE